MAIPNKQIDFQSVGELIQRLEARRTTQERFNVEMPENKLMWTLYAYYHSEVTRRGNEPTLNEEQKQCIREAATWLADPYGKPGLLLQGLYGNGKTTMMRAIVTLINDLYDSCISDEKYSIKTIDAKEIARIGISNNDRHREEFKRLCTEPMLAIDDLGEEPAEIISYGMIYTPVKDLLLERYKRQAFTIVTTNLVNTSEKKELTEHYGERVVDRFREMMKIIVFKNPSYRK